MGWQLLIQPSDAVRSKVFDAIDFSTICREGAAGVCAESIPDGSTGSWGAGTPGTPPPSCAKPSAEPRGADPWVMVMLSLSLPRQQDSSLWLLRYLLLAPQGSQVLGEGVALLGGGGGAGD